MRSIKGRLTLTVTICLLTLLGLQAVGLRVIPHALLEDYVVTRLQHDAETLYAHFVAAPGDVRAFTRSVGIIYETPLSGHYFRIDTNGTAIRSRSLWDEDLPPIRLAPGDTQVAHIPGPARQNLLVYSGGYVAGDQMATISVAEDISAMEKTVQNLERALLLAMLAALGFVLLLQLVVIRKALHPLDEAVAACRRLESGEAVPVDIRAPTEVAPVVEAINRLIRHHGHRLERTRRALGNVGHALKTPLAVLVQISDEVASRGDSETAAVLRGQVDAMRNTIERELRRARLAGHGHPGAGFDASSELDALAGVLRRLHDNRVEIELDIRRTARLPIDTEDMNELFGNLLDNACKWASSKVRVTVYDEPVLHAVVEDDGPGVPQEDLTRLGTTGLRLDESRPGHGLGLAIVQDIVRQYGGEIRYGRSRGLGGLRAEVTTAPSPE